MAGSGAYCMAGARCVNAFRGFMVLMLKGLRTRETSPRGIPAGTHHRSGGRIPLEGERGASAGHRRDRLVASTVHGDDLVESADPKDLVDLLR